MYQQPNNGHGQGPAPNRGGYQATNQYQQYSQQAAYGQQQQFGQQQYGQTGFPGDFNQGGPSNRGGIHSNTYPPPKRQKGNPVITRYAPPPGYQAPPAGQPWQGARGGGASGSGQYSAPTQAYQNGYQQQSPGFNRPSGPPNFQNGWQPHQGQFSGGPVFQSPQGYTGPPQNFPQPQQQQGPQTYPRPGFQGQQGFQHRQPQTSGGFGSGSYPPGQGQQARTGFQQQQGNWQGSSASQNAFPTRQDGFGGSPNHHDQASRSGRASIGSIGSMPPPPTPSASQGQSVSVGDVQMEDDAGAQNTEPDPNDPLNMKEHDWTFDPEGAIWPKATEVVDNKLSLGLIIWHPGNKMTRAIPSTFPAAEQFARTAPPPLIGLGDSVSAYFTKANHEHAYEDIRSLAHWRRVKKDPVFVDFPQECESYDISTVKAWRNRPDVVIEPVDESDDEEEISIDPGAPNDTTNSSDQPSHQTSQNAGAPSAGQPHTVTSQIDKSQEDILASLGVEGPPRPVYPTPGPAYGSQSADKFEQPVNTLPSHGTSQVPLSSSHQVQAYPAMTPAPNSSESYPPPDDPIEQAIARAISGAHAPRAQKSPAEPVPMIKNESFKPQPYDPWNPDQGMPVPKEPSPAPSNKTQVGSDFDHDMTEGITANGNIKTPPSMQMEEDSKLPLLRHESSASRKRSYDNFNDREEDHGDRKRRQSDDDSKANQLSNSRRSSADAYSRR